MMVPGLAALTLLLGGAGRVAADVIYQTGFENPPFVLGALSGQDGWSVFGVSGAATVQNTVVATGSQAAEVDASLVGAQQTGPYRIDPFDTSMSSNKVVVMQADVRLSSSTTETAWQFAALTDLAHFIGGFNVLPDGQLQLITPGFPLTASVVARDTWNHYEVLYDFGSDTFDVLINNTLIASNEPFLTNETVFGLGLFDTFGSGNDQGFLDNYSVTTLPEPSSLALLALGGLALAGWRRWKRKRATA